MTDHPIDQAIVDGVAVAKAGVRGYEKQYARLTFANADAVRNTSLSGHYGGIYVTSLQSAFDLSASDTTSADDGLLIIVDADGNRFRRVFGDVVYYYSSLGATVADAVAALPDGGTLHIPAGDNPALPTDFPGVTLEYDGPAVPFWYGQGAGPGDLNFLADKLIRTQHAGPHTDTKCSVGIETEIIGSGLPGAAVMDVGLEVHAWKRNWTEIADRSTIGVGQLDGIDVYLRNGGPSATQDVNNSDTSAYGYNVSSIGDCGFVCGMEGVAYSLSDVDYSAEYGIDVQLAAINRTASPSVDVSNGLRLGAVVGANSTGLLIDEIGGTWDYGVIIGNFDAIHYMDGSQLLGSATGGTKGAGTINAKAVYDDDSILTCPAASAEFIGNLTVDLAKWDAFVPDHVIPEHKAKVPAPESKRTAADFDVIYDKDGNGIAATPLPITEQVTVPEKRSKREHFAARRLKQMVDAGFDPRSADQYFAKLEADEAIPGMPTQAEWEHSKFSLGELQSCAWLAKELQALAMRDLLNRVKALEALSAPK